MEHALHDRMLSGEHLTETGTAETSRFPKGRVMLLLTNLSPTGGAEVQSIQLALRLKRRGWTVSMASLLPITYPFPLLAENGIPVRSANMRKGPGAALAIHDLVRLIREFRPDVLHCHMTQAILAGRLTRAVTGVPVVIGTLHGLMMYSVTGRHQRWSERFHRLTDSLAEVTTVVCQAGLTYYYESKTISAGRLRYVPNGVDTDECRPDVARRHRLRGELGLGEDFAWAYVARFDPIKDPQTALLSFARTLERVPRSQLLLAGGGTLEPELRELAKKLRIEHRVQFLGRREDVAALMNAADGMILTSRFEALPMVLLEAGACGLPAVASEVGGNGEVVLEGKTGYLAPVGDVQTFADRMTQLAQLPPAERVQMAVAARRHVKRHYQFDAVMDHWESLYFEMLVRVGALRVRGPQ